MAFRPLIYTPAGDPERWVAALMARHGVDEAQARAALTAKLSANAVTDGKWVATIHELAGGVTHLAIHRRDGSVDHDWRELQRVKSAVAPMGAYRWAAELYPPESLVVDLAPQYHLWTLPLGQRFPFGFLDGRRVAADPRGEPFRLDIRPRPERAP